MKISIQGERGSFHEVAARQFFKTEHIDLVECATFDQTINSVTGRKADFAVMAIENARSGSILYNYNLIRESGLRILGEHKLRVRQNLMVFPGTSLEEIYEIRSHPIALAQCMEFLNGHPGIKLVESDDTAASARRIREEQIPGVGTIASADAAAIYGLEIVARGIETYKKNYTRFLVLGSEEKMKLSGNKISVCFATGHKPGSLARVLVILAEMNINLSKIQSVPRLNGGWEYMFYLDLELNDGLTVEKVVKAIEEHTVNLEVLGVYELDDILYES